MGGFGAVVGLQVGSLALSIGPQLKQEYNRNRKQSLKLFDDPRRAVSWRKRPSAAVQKLRWLQRGWKWNLEIDVTRERGPLQNLIVNKGSSTFFLQYCPRMSTRIRAFARYSIEKVCWSAQHTIVHDQLCAV